MQKQFTKGKTVTTIFENDQYELHITKGIKGQFDNGTKVKFKKGERVEVNPTCAQLFARHGELTITPITFTTKNATLKKYKKRKVFTVREVKLDIKVRQTPLGQALNKLSKKNN